MAICLLYFFLPLYLFEVLANPGDVSEELGLIFFFLFFHTAALWILGASILRLLGVPWRSHSLILLALLIPNPCLFPSQLGLLLIPGLDARSLEAASRVFHVSLLIVPTVGTYLASNEHSIPGRLFDTVRLPIAPLALVGLVWGLASPGPGQSSQSVIESVSLAAAPLTFLLVGILIGKEFYLFDLTNITPMLLAAVLATLLRLIVSPILAAMLVKIMPVEPVLGRLLVIHSAMPTAAFTAVLAAYFCQSSSDKRYIVLCVVGTGLLSCITLPIVITMTR